MGSVNIVDKNAVSVKNNHVIVGHLPHGKSGKFAKMILYFLRANKYAEYKVIINVKKVNFGDGRRMQVLCLLKTSGTKNKLQILCRNIQN